MKACRLTISTTIDGKETRVTRDGEYSFDEQGVRLCYREENAVVGLLLKDSTLTVERRGDYRMLLRLCENCTLQGELGIGDSVGDIRIQTLKLQSRAEKDAWLLLAEYVLLAGTQPQKTKLRLSVKTK